MNLKATELKTVLYEVRKYFDKHYVPKKSSNDFQLGASDFACCFSELDSFNNEKIENRKEPKPVFNKSVTGLNTMPGLDELLHKKELTFVDYLNKLMLEKNIDAPTVYKRSNMDKRLFHKFSSRSYSPAKKTVLALIFGLHLNMQEAKEMLNYAGYSLSPSNRTDVIVSYFLEQYSGRADIDLVNSVLYAYGEKILGSKAD